MLKIENVEVTGWEHAIRGMRNPMNSWEKSNSKKMYDMSIVSQLLGGLDQSDHTIKWILDNAHPYFELGPNDLDLMMTLRNSGTDHRKFMRMITVYLDITAPLYWWKEFDTYKVGTVANSCSTMHKIHAKEFTLDDFSCEHLMDCLDGDYEAYNNSPGRVLRETIVMLNMCRDLYLQTKDKQYWWQLIQLLPSSYNQKRTIMLNYEVLANMFAARCNHKLDEWKQLCEWMRTLPYSELITGEYAAPSTKNTSRVVRHAYIQSIEKGFPDDGPYLRMYTRGYEDGKPGLGAENTIDAALLIDPDNIPFEKGTLVKVTIEEEEK